MLKKINLVTAQCLAAVASLFKVQEEVRRGSCREWSTKSCLKDTFQLSHCLHVRVSETMSFTKQSASSALLFYIILICLL